MLLMLKGPKDFQVETKLLCFRIRNQAWPIRFKCKIMLNRFRNNTRCRRLSFLSPTKWNLTCKTKRPSSKPRCSRIKVSRPSPQNTANQCKEFQSNSNIKVLRCSSNSLKKSNQADRMSFITKPTSAVSRDSQSSSKQSTLEKRCIGGGRRAYRWTCRRWITRTSNCHCLSPTVISDVKWRRNIRSTYTLYSWLRSQP